MTNSEIHIRLARQVERRRQEFGERRESAEWEQNKADTPSSQVAGYDVPSLGKERSPSQIWAGRQWYYELLCRKVRENAQQELFAEEELHRSRVALCFWLAVGGCAVALVMWLVGC